MGRKHRRVAAPALGNVERLANGGASNEIRRGKEWFVRDIPVNRADKVYRCPGCQRDIPPGQAHIVAWPADHIFGDAAGVRDRRHWHSHCWRLP